MVQESIGELLMNYLKAECLMGSKVVKKAEEGDSVDDPWGLMVKDTLVRSEFMRHM